MHGDTGTAMPHKETRLSSGPAGTLSQCTCGAVWTHPPLRAREDMDSIFASHVKTYENRTTVL